MSRRSRGSLRLGKPDPGSAQPTFSMEDVGFQRLYLGNADASELAPVNRTGVEVPASGATFAISSATDTADYSTATVAGTCQGSGLQPHNAYVSACWSWKMFDILGNPVTGATPVILQWAVVLTSRDAVGEEFPDSGNLSVNPRSWLCLGVSGDDAENLDDNSQPALSGFEVKTHGNVARHLSGMALKGGNMTGEAGLATTCGKVTVATMTMGPDDSGICTAGPLASTILGVKTAGTNTYAGQEIYDSRNYDRDTSAGLIGLELAPNSTTQLNWMLALGRQTLTPATSDTVAVWRFRIYARAIPAIMYSNADPTWRNFARTWL